MASRLFGAAATATAAAALLGTGVAGAAVPRAHRHGSPTPAQLIARSAHALATVNSFTLNGYFQLGKGRVGLLLRSTARGARAEGTMTSTTKPGIGFVGKVSFVRLGASFYLKGDQRFWASSAGSMPKAALKALGSQWIRMPGNQVKNLAGTFGAFTNPSRLATSVLGTPGARGLHVGKPTKAAGEPVVTIRSSDGVLYLARRGAPLPVVITARGRNGGSFHFAYPAKLTIKAPKGAKTITQVEKAAIG